MFRSTANMQPGGFYVGNTTGWMTGAAQPEFLRRVASLQTAQTRRAGVGLTGIALHRSGTESTSRSWRTTTCRLGECCMRAQAAAAKRLTTSAPRLRAFCIRINTGKQPTYCLGNAQPSTQYYEVRACIRAVQRVALPER